MSQPAKTLKSSFGDCLKAYNDIKLIPGRQDSDAFQKQIQDTIQQFIDLKQGIASASVFSVNESFEDINTSEIRMLSLEYYLAELYSLYIKPVKTVNLKKAVILYLQYLKNLYNYNILDKLQVKKYDKLKQNPFEVHNTSVIIPSREEKIANYRLEKSLSQKLQFLNDLESNDDDYQKTDEEELRGLYLSQLKLFALKAFENIRFIIQELDFLQNVPEPKITEVDEESRDSTEFTEKLETIHKAPLSKEGKILKPFTLVKKDDLRKKVFGTGQYLPTVTVEEFLEQELANGGMISGGGNEQDVDSSDEDDETKNDHETYKKREWDEFVETHPKGYGNTTNRG